MNSYTSRKTWIVNNNLTSSQRRRMGRGGKRRKKKLIGLEREVEYKNRNPVMVVQGIP